MFSADAHAVEHADRAVAAATALVSTTASLGAGVTPSAQTLAMADVAYIAVLHRCAIVGLVAVSFNGIRIGRVHLLTDPVVLAVVNRAFGEPAIQSLLATVLADGEVRACYR